MSAEAITLIVLAVAIPVGLVWFISVVVKL